MEAVWPRMIFFIFFCLIPTQASSCMCQLLIDEFPDPPDTSVPPGGATITLQDECIQTTPKYRERQKPMNIEVDDAMWQDFAGKLFAIVRTYWNPWMPALISPILFVLAIVVDVLLLPAFEIYLPSQYIVPPVVVAGALVGWICSAVAICLNSESDDDIHRLCADFEAATRGLLEVEYRTAGTGLCSHPRTRTLRLIAFTPFGPYVSTRQVMPSNSNVIVVGRPTALQQGVLHP